MKGGEDSIVCSGCGAVLGPASRHCDLCGLSAESTDDESEVPSESGEIDGSNHPAIQVPVTGVAENRPKCSACGHSNESDARFCSRCGMKLFGTLAHAPTDVSAEHRLGTSSGARALSGVSLIAIVATGAIAVLLLYGVTLLSKEAGSAGPEMTAPGERPPLPEMTGLPAEIESRASRLEEEIAETTDQMVELDLRQELVSMYQQAGRLDLAAEAQRPVAEALEAPYAWTFLGDLYYDWMLSQDSDQAAGIAHYVIDAYEKSLELNPDDLDVRTHLAVAYLYDPSNPMRAVDEINRVLEVDPAHLQANYNRGIMLAQIGRYDEAVQQFERVIELAEDGSTAQMRAQEALQSVQRFSEGS